MAQLQDGGLNATVTLSLSGSALSAASLATAGVGEICQLYISGTDSTQKISVVLPLSYIHLITEVKLQTTQKPIANQ